MIGLVIVTHGRLAEEFVAAMEHVVGPQTAVSAISIGPEDDMERRRQEIVAAAQAVNSGDGVLLLTDMFEQDHAVQPGDLSHGRGAGGSDRRAESADADQAGQRARPRKPADLRRPGSGGRPQIHLRGLLRAGGGGVSEAVRRTVEIVNARGLHARASAKFVKAAAQYDAEVTVSRDGQSVNAQSIMGLMMLGAGPGSVVEIAATGPDAAVAVEELVQLIADRFDEER